MIFRDFIAIAFRVVVLLVCSMSVPGCGGGGSPTAPRGPGFAGEWSGTTGQGRPMSFSVSADQKVTAISVGYAFSGCAGVETISNVDTPILGSSFAYGTSLPDGRGIQVVMAFVQPDVAGVGVVFYGPPGCGSTGTDVGYFFARRR